MTPPLRFICRFDETWRVKFECPGAVAAWAKWNVPERQLDRLVVDPIINLPKPSVDIHDPSAKAHVPPSAGTDEAVKEAYRSIVTRQGAAQVERFGHYLFHALLDDAWLPMTQVTEEAGADTLELAIAVPDYDLHLQRLNWELMHSGEAFLAAGTKKVGVAITRLVAGVTDANARVLTSPPKYLWVIGSPLDDESIRPGAELMGLLREVRDRKPMRTRLLDNANPKTLQDAIDEFEPDVVHFICHGLIDDAGVPYLDLRHEDGNKASHRSSVQLIADLRGSGRRFPAIVILSACSTAAGGGTDRYVLGARETSPMAVDLIVAGVPVVIGMSGRVGDRTCRLFTRQFGKSILDGEQLVEAVATARMATFKQGGLPQTTVDWALPTVYLAESVPSSYRPIPTESQDPIWGKIDGWIRDSKLPGAPVFCGRHAFFDEFRAMYRQQSTVPNRQVMVLRAPGAGYGSERLLKELAMAAVWDGRLPIVIGAPKRGPHQGTWPEFVNALRTAIANSSFRSGSKGTQLENLLAGNQRDLDHEVGMGRKLSGSKMPPSSVALALRIDLDDLLDDVVEHQDYFRAGEAQVVVFLDDIDRWGPEVVEALFEPPNGSLGAMLGHFGLGTSQRPIPVVLAFSPDEPSDGTLQPISDLAEIWLGVLDLGAFGRGEDILAYRWVLLNPASARSNALNGKAWTFADQPPDALQAAEERFRKHVKGLPAEMVGLNRGLYVAAKEAQEAAELVSADDEDLVRFGGQP